MVHSLPGRTRFHLKSSDSPTMIEYFIRSHSSVYSATYTKETGNVSFITIYLSLHTLKNFFNNYASKSTRKFDHLHGENLSCSSLYSYVSSKLVYPKRPFPLAVKQITNWSAVILPLLYIHWGYKRWNFKSYSRIEKQMPTP